MVLNTRQWGPEAPDRVVCIHGLAQHSGVFDGLGQRLAAGGHSVLGVDLRGHGGSGGEPPWNTETHAQDVADTLEDAGVERAILVGHSYGGRVASVLAAAESERSRGLAMLETPGSVSPARALRAIEVERLDWSFATVDGVIEAVMSSDVMVAPPREVVTAFVKDDVQRGPDGRYRLGFSPGTVVVAWNEMTLPPPPIAPIPTLLVCATKTLVDTSERATHYSETLGELLTRVEVPNGHNVLWESPAETLNAIESFITKINDKEYA